ncbi:MAG: hypothetical protein ACREQ7_06205 [Candidatus Binatia bacterium]
MNRMSPLAVAIVAAAFFAGFFTYFLYLRWSPPVVGTSPSASGKNVHDTSQSSLLEARSYTVEFVPPEPFEEKPAELPVLQARDVEKIRGLAGNRARIRGRIFRVGHSVKSNTYFLNFGPSRAALTAVIFASAVELFEKSKLPPKDFEGKEVEMQGEIKDHPQYGLELILENPSQIKLIE